MTTAVGTPVRVQRQRAAGWRMPLDAVYVGRPTRWGNPFRYRTGHGLVRFQPATPDVVDYEGRISADGMRHDWWGPDGTVTEFHVRYATLTECVSMYRQTLLDPTPSMRMAAPSTGGRLVRVSVDDVREHLRGRDLACWCSLSSPCHADVLLEVANGAA